MGNGDSKVPFTRRLSWKRSSLTANSVAPHQPFGKKPTKNTRRLRLQGYWIDSSVEIPRSQSVSGLLLRASNSLDGLNDGGCQINALAAHQAFKRHRADIVNTGDAAVQFFGQLLTKDVIPEATKTRVVFSALSKSEKYVALIDAIEARIVTNPAVFETIVTSLKTDPVLHTFGTKIMDSYREYDAAHTKQLKVMALPATFKYGEFLNAYYKALLPPSKYKWPPTASRKPFNLTVIQYTSSQIIKNESTSLQYLLAPPDSGAQLSCVLLVGDAGVGKSSLTVELCKHWDEIETLRSYCLVLLLRGQEKRVQEAKTLGDLLSYHNNSIQPEVSRELIENEGDGLLLIIDAIDLVPASCFQHSSTVMRILQGSYLPKATLLLTCRTPAMKTVLTLCKRKVNRCVELSGFTQDEIEQHAETSLGFDSVLLSDFHNYLSSNPAIRNIMHVPLHTAVLVESFKEAKLLKCEPPKTLTELYEQLAHQLLKYHLLLQGGMDTFVSPYNFEHLPQKVYQQLCTLAKLAFTTLVNKENGVCKFPKGFYHLGFMSAIPELYKRKNAPLLYSFLHPHLQEYLASFHVTNLSVEEQKDFYTNHFNSSHLQGLWRFVAGMTHLRGALWEVELAKLSKEGLLSPTQLQCLFEAHKHVSCDHIFRKEKEVTYPQAQYGEDTTALECYQLACCLAQSTCTLKLRLRLDTKMLQHFLLGLRSSAYSATKVETLFLRPPITEHTISTLRELPPLLLTGLDLSHCSLNSSIVHELATVIPHLISLTHLDIRGNPIGEGGMVNLFHSLTSLCSLKSLNIINTGFGCMDIDALAPLFSNWSALKKLSIGDENLPSEYIPVLLHTTLTNAQLEHLHLWLLDMQPHMNLVANLLCVKHSSVTRLEFHGCLIGEDGCQLLAHSLAVNTSLRNLVFSMFDIPVANQLGPQGATSLANVLRVNRTLESLEISFDRSLGRNGALSLISALENNKTLKMLKLPQQNLSQMEMKVVDKRVLWSSP